jgi:hypothetical protein
MDLIWLVHESDSFEQNEARSVKNAGDSVKENGAGFDANIFRDPTNFIRTPDHHTGLSISCKSFTCNGLGDFAFVSAFLDFADCFEQIPRSRDCKMPNAQRKRVEI